MSKISNITKGLEYLLYGFFLIGLSSCSISKYIPEGKYLVAKAGVDVKKISGSTERDRVREDLTAIMVQKPNRRFLGLLPIRMWFYLAAAKGKNNKFNQWVKSKLGEAPVVFDSLLATKSEMLMENYLWNEGYFENDVMFHTKIRRKKRLTVTFSVEPGQPWRIGNIIFPSGNSVGEAITRIRSGNTLLGSGMRFNIGVLKQERSRIETDLRNNGFVFFNKEFITFDLDTNRNSHTVNIYIKVNPPSDTTEHKPFRINKVFVFDNYDQSLSETLDLIEKTDTSYLKEFIFIHTKEILKKKALREAIFFRQGELFTQDNFNRTMVRLNELGVFKFVSIDLQRSHRDSALINMLVFLTPSMKQTLSGGLNLNHNFEGLTGFGGN
ncbi:MAG: hypothetical protein NZ522_05545, partial [Chitinophagales bacterium]|nr:hypothetical protein [Chitinophagales bacterium]